MTTGKGMISRTLMASALAAALSATAWAAGPSRVVSLNLCTDQWLMLLAPEKAVGLTFLSRDPALSFVSARAARVSVVRASAEAVLALRPDLVLGARFGARTTLDLLARSGVPVDRIALPTNFAGIRVGLRTLARQLGVPERAEPLIAAMDAALPHLAAPPDSGRTALVWEPRGWTSGPRGLMAAVLRAAGLVNMGSGRRVGLEALLRRPPALLVLTDGGGGASLATEMAHHPAVRGIPMRVIPAPLTICPGPFTAWAVRRLLAPGHKSRGPA
jgi:iron complex transport system substrate-binding protein